MEHTQLLQAIAHARAGEWDASHSLVMPERSAEACWLHAILHSIEGDHDNAAYWYGRAGRPPATQDPETELDLLEEQLRGTA